jgi:hypothetical protein
MASDDNALAQATDDLIALYRSLERRTLDLPVISFAPLLISSLATLEFFLLFWFALFLMIPINLVILIRNVFPGNWQYRPFFFTQVRYVLRWIWQGEPPSGPTIFIRPLFNLFMKDILTVGCAVYGKKWYLAMDWTRLHGLLYKGGLMLRLRDGKRPV